MNDYGVTRMVADVLAEYDTERTALAEMMKNGAAHWGNWYYVPDQDAGVLEYREPGDDSPYEVDLARCNTAIEILDWILHIEEKSWLSVEGLGYFIQALAEILDMRGWVHKPNEVHDVRAIVAALLARA